MKIFIHALAWPLTLSVACADKEEIVAGPRVIRQELFKGDEHEKGESGNQDSMNAKTGLGMQNVRSLAFKDIANDPGGPLSLQQVDKPPKQGFDSLVDKKKDDEDPNSPLVGRIRRAKRSRNKKSRHRRAASDDRRMIANNNGNLHHEDNKVLLNQCVQGTSSFVTDKCRFFNCCQGENACDWPDNQIATVCPDSCNGYKACFYVGAGTFVDRESCNGSFSNGYGYSCAYFAVSSTQASSSIGTNSCNGERACFYMCYSSKECKATIGNDACNGQDDCAFIGEPYYYQNFQIESIIVGDGSCVSYGESFSEGEACNYVGANARRVNIGTDACRGARSCRGVGYYANLRVAIGDGSCTDDRACFAFGENAGSDGFTSKVLVGENACTDYEACTRLGLNTYYDVRVDDSSCTSYKSCYRFGVDVSNSAIRIEENQCRQEFQCAGSDDYNPDCDDTAFVPNSGGSCPTV